MIRFHRQTHYNYWSHSKLSKYIRKQAGLDNPSALSAEDWDAHHKESKEKAPFVNWLTDEFFNKVQRFVMYIPDWIYSVGVFYRNWKDKSNVLEGGFEVGQWVDRCTRFNTCLFYELEKFIEKEKTLETLAWEKTLTYGRDLGYSENDENFGKPTTQALAAVEQEIVYNWWKANKARDFFKESGLAAVYDFEHGDSFWESYNKSKENPEREACLKKELELESKFKQEEEEMLIRLIKIRDHLWT